MVSENQYILDTSQMGSLMNWRDNGKLLDHTGRNTLPYSSIGDTVTLKFHSPKKKMEDVKGLINDFLSRPYNRVKALARIVGKLCLLEVQDPYLG